MLLLGIDVGTSSIKVSVVDADNSTSIASAQYPEVESGIKSLQPGWAEQDPEMWWDHVQQAIKKLPANAGFSSKDVGAIGIAYQMHGLVVVDKDQKTLRDSIIWCDSRAVPFGEEAFHAIGTQTCLSNLLNSPGNFTASKLAWVKKNEPALFEKIDKIMLPGDFIAMKLTGEITTSASALSEGVFWNFKDDSLSSEVMKFYHFDEALIPAVQPVFASHGNIKDEVADTLGLRRGIAVTYKAGDQPNNALSLNVLKPGEVAATAGTSGVIYGVSDELTYDQQSRINTFAHVNHSASEKRLGILLCINGTGILNRWIRDIAGGGLSYKELDKEAAGVAVGSNGLKVQPFGNGAERMLNNKIIGAHYSGIDFNIHTRAHMIRASQEGIAFAFRYGLDIMRHNGLNPGIIRAGRSNMFFSDVFTHAFVNATNVPVELYANDGSAGAAIGAGIGAKIFSNESEAFEKTRPLQLIEPDKAEEYNEHYMEWKRVLDKMLSE